MRCPDEEGLPQVLLWVLLLLYLLLIIIITITVIIIIITTTTRLCQQGPDLELVLALEVVMEALDRHVVEGKQAVECDAVCL